MENRSAFANFLRSMFYQEGFRLCNIIYRMIEIFIYVKRCKRIKILFGIFDIFRRPACLKRTYDYLYVFLFLFSILSGRHTKSYTFKTSSKKSLSNSILYDLSEICCMCVYVRVCVTNFTRLSRTIILSHIYIHIQL